ncbi:Calcium/calmodulin-dependent protein kinase kinase 2 [Porphyridium purpureum]|uniref:Calcium/calmodulin-dependent protein kinase kinase 2 n=1 Tax=Porphyridium purpureum TaxID=35688 RepID=A0A5J4YSR4_PORPP|nr:Calcium/calmodulin-dependent protein kinase kinase 2 [Porphyridium purpureum]|eukprot:POR3122..scf236_6
MRGSASGSGNAAHVSAHHAHEEHAIRAAAPAPAARSASMETVTQHSADVPGSSSGSGGSSTTAAATSVAKVASADAQAVRPDAGAAHRLKIAPKHPIGDSRKRLDIMYARELELTAPLSAMQLGGDSAAPRDTMDTLESLSSAANLAHRSRAKSESSPARIIGVPGNASADTLLPGTGNADRKLDASKGGLGSRTGSFLGFQNGGKRGPIRPKGISEEVHTSTAFGDHESSSPRKARASMVEISDGKRGSLPGNATGVNTGGGTTTSLSPSKGTSTPAGDLSENPGLGGGGTRPEKLSRKKSSKLFVFIPDRKIDTEGDENSSDAAAAPKVSSARHENGPRKTLGAQRDGNASKSFYNPKGLRTSHSSSSHQKPAPGERTRTDRTSDRSNTEKSHTESRSIIPNVSLDRLSDLSDIHDSADTELLSTNLLDAAAGDQQQLLDSIGSPSGRTRRFRRWDSKVLQIPEADRLALRKVCTLPPPALLPFTSSLDCVLYMLRPVDVVPAFVRSSDPSSKRAGTGSAIAGAAAAAATQFATGLLGRRRSLSNAHAPHTISSGSNTTSDQFNGGGGSSGVLSPVDQSSPSVVPMRVESAYLYLDDTLELLCIARGSRRLEMLCSPIPLTKVMKIRTNGTELQLEFSTRLPLETSINVRVQSTLSSLSPRFGSSSYGSFGSVARGASSAHSGLHGTATATASSGTYCSAVNLTFSSREAAEMWLMGLCALVSPSAKLYRQKAKAAPPIPGGKPYNAYVDTFDRKSIWEWPVIGDAASGREYVLLRTIGRGSFGEVRLALGIQQECFFAVKTLSKTVLRKQKRAGLFAKKQTENFTSLLAENREIQIMKVLDHHPNLVGLVDVFDDPKRDSLFMVLDYMEGGLLMDDAHKLEGAEPLSEADAFPIFIDMLRGVEFLHDNRVVHRDLKPSNVLKKADGRIKISDLGSSFCFQAQDAPGAGSAGAAANLEFLAGDPLNELGVPLTVAPKASMLSPRMTSDSGGNASSRGVGGTPAFMPPEMCASTDAPTSSPDIPYCVDIWSLGATLYYMLYGRVPFRGGSSVTEMFRAICCDELEFPDTRNVSQDAKSLLRQMLEKNGFLRISLADTWNHPWVTRRKHLLS